MESIKAVYAHKDKSAKRMDPSTTRQRGMGFIVGAKEQEKETREGSNEKWQKKDRTREKEREREERISLNCTL